MRSAILRASMKIMRKMMIIIKIRRRAKITQRRRKEIKRKRTRKIRRIRKRRSTKNIRREEEI